VSELALCAPRSALPLRALLATGVVAGLSAAMSFAAGPLGHAIALAGYSDAATLHTITIGEDTIRVPENMIRSQQARHDGPALRLDLYVRWPDLGGFSEAARDDFNNRDDVRRILFLTFEPRTMSRDMTGRLEPIYRSLVASPGTPGPGGAVEYAFNAGSGYVNEVLVEARGDGGAPLVARCLSGEASAGALAPCERDIALGRNLSLTYRFPRELLAQWPALEAAVRRLADKLVSA
jgi:hypothetical protein